MSSSASPKKIWTILDLITWGTGYLTEKNIDDARLTIELMLAHVLRFKRIQLYTSFDRPMSEDELARFKELLKRRLTGEPLQYILGETEFMGLKFAVDARVLIPRPETELLVEKAVELIKQKYLHETAISILDIGTGSGCIAISLAVLVPNANILAIDISAEALAVAKKNAEDNGVAERIEFRQADILTLQDHSLTQQFHCILANPPYISLKESAEVPKEVKDFEPGASLTDNENGLKYYPVIAHIAQGSLVKEGIVGVEHAYDQSESIRKIFQEYNFLHPIVVKDYQGIQRHLFFS